MSIEQIIKEAIDKNPLGMKEALEEELKNRIRLALEASEEEMDDEDDMDDEDEEDDEDDMDDEEDEDEEDEDDVEEGYGKKKK